MAVIGLTGGIGTGKSTVSKYLVKKGFEIADADQIARDITLPGSPVINRITAAFGEEFVVDGVLQRKKLGKYVFESAERKKTLDGIMMTTIISIIDERIHNAEGHIIIDAPLLFEVGLDNRCDRVFVVNADTEVRIERVMNRDGISRQEVLDRIANQMPMEDKIERADFVLDNSGSREELYHQIDEAIKEYV